MSDEYYFVCPKCGGHHFGADTGMVNGEIDTLDTVQCHNADDGSPLIDVMTRIIKKLPKQKPCGWRGEWPVTKGDSDESR